MGSWYSELLVRVYDWLSPSDPPVSADVIFTLAGRQTRKEFACELYAQGLSPVLLLSVGRFEIRRLAQLHPPNAVDLQAIAASVPALQRHYFVVYEPGHTTTFRIHRGTLGTLSEIRALARWLRQSPAMRSVLIVSSGFHLRRVRACCRALLPAKVKLHYVAVPHDAPYCRTGWWQSPRARLVVLREFPKLVAYYLALLCKNLHLRRRDSLRFRP